jgi:DNA-directed RNA polymerase specialized sigma24 family protein
MPSRQPVSHAHKHLSNPRILAQLEAMVRGFVKPAHVNDCVQRVCVAALAAANPPEAEPQFVGFLRGIMEKDVPRYMKALAREPILEPQHAEENVEARPAFQDEEMAAGARAAEARDAKQEQTKQWVGDIAEGRTVQEISARDGVAADTIWKRLHRARKWMGPLALLFAILGGGWAAWEYQHREDIVADQNTLDPNLLEARSLRDRAMASCNAGDWGSCESQLDGAGRLDPAGEDIPWVKALRRHIADARALQQMQPAPTAPDKPHASDKPPKPR